MKKTFIYCLLYTLLYTGRTTSLLISLTIPAVQENLPSYAVFNDILCMNYLHAGNAVSSASRYPAFRYPKSLLSDVALFNNASFRQLPLINVILKPPRWSLASVSKVIFTLGPSDRKAMFSCEPKNRRMVLLSEE